jgi:hypothetical protein
MTNLLEQPHTRPRLVAVIGGRRRPTAPAASATTTARRRPAPATAVTRATREATRLDRVHYGRAGRSPERLTASG